MARQRGNSSGGTILLILFGALAAAVSAVYRFTVENAAAIGVITLICALIAIPFMISRARSAKRADPIGLKPPPLDSGPRTRAFQVPSAPVERSPPARWIRSGETAKFGNAELYAGMFYYGGWLPLAEGTTRQYAINPKLPASGSADVEGRSMPYWPSYADISPGARRAFLDWMAGGRRDPSYGIGLVFIFLYGLEHRLFLEGGDDAPLLVREVERLLAIYGSNNSFHGYASNFLDFARLAQGERLEVSALSPERRGGPEMDLQTRLYLGNRLAEAPALSAEDALRWVLEMPDTYLRTPAVRCFDEFVALWRLRFDRIYPGGLPVNGRDRISVRYRAASGSFDVAVRGPHEQHIDVARVTKPLPGLQKLVTDCTDELDSFSRLVGRKPSARNSMAAAKLLPADLQQSTTAGAIVDFRHRVEAVMGDHGRGSSTAQIMLEMAGIEVPADGKISAASADELGRALDSIGVAIEPDRRYGSSVPRADEQVFVFRAANGGPVDPARASFRAVRAQVEVAVLAAAADGDASYEELQRTIARIRSATDLFGVEQARLIAFAVTTFNNPPKQARVMRKLAETTEGERQAIADAAIAVIGGNGNVDAGEVKFLERLHKSLGLPKERVYSGLHSAAARQADDPVPISGEDRAAGVPLPKEAPSPILPAVAARGISIDSARLARTRRDTEAVSALLSDIFAEDVVQPQQAPPEQAALDGLDGPHTELVELLELRGSMTRTEFDRHAKEMRLLPDGAIERINDWSFDRFDEALIEDGDEVVVAPHLRGKIAEMKDKAA